MAGWSIRIDDDDDGSFADEADLAAEIVEINETLNGDEYAKFRLPNTTTNRTMVSADHDVRIQYNSVTIFYGRMTGCVYSHLWLEVLVHNKVWEKAHRTLFGDPDADPVEGDYTDGATDTAILAAICTVGSWTAGTTTGSTRYMRFDNATCFDAIWYLAQTVDKDIWTGGEDDRGATVSTINFGSRGTDKGTISVIGVSDHAVDRSLKRDKVYVIGSDELGTRIVGESGAGSSEIVFRERTSIDSDSLDSIAARRATELNTETIGSRVTVTIAVGYNIYPGDTGTFDFSIINLPSGSYRVIRTVKKIATVDIELDRSFKTAAEMFKDLSSLENIGIYSGEWAAIPKAGQPAGCDILFYAGLTAGGSLATRFFWHDGLSGNPTIILANGDSWTITKGDSDALAASTIYKVYVDITDDVPGGTLTIKTTTDDIDPSLHPSYIVLATVITPAQSTENVSIIPNSDICQVRPVIGTPLFGAGVIVTPDFRTAYNVGAGGGPAGVAVNSGGIIGYYSGTSKSFYLDATTGDGMAGAGTVRMNESGITIDNDTNYMLSFIDSGDNVTNMGCGAAGWLVESDERINILGAENIVLNTAGGELDLQCSGLFTIGSSGGNINILSVTGDITTYGDIIPYNSTTNTFTVGASGNVYKSVYATNFYGSSHYADLHMSDLFCAKCGKEFKLDDQLVFVVSGFNDDENVGKEIKLIPIHLRC